MFKITEGKMKFYGDRFVVYENGSLSLDEIIEAYKEWYGRKRQNSRYHSDLKELAKLDKGKLYGWCTRQAGAIGERVQTGKGYRKVVFSSLVIDWN